MFKNMFKSKVFRYCAIAVTVVITSGAIVAGNATLQSQSQLKKQAQSQPQAETQIQSQIPSQSTEPDKLAELPNQDKLLDKSTDKLSERGNKSDIPSGKVLKQLNLTTEQLQKLKEIRDRDLPRIRELSQQSRQANRELRDLLVGTESTDAIRTKHDRVLSIQMELQKQHFERMLAMREILTPQQRSQLNEIMQKNRPDRMRDEIQNRMEKRIEKREGLRDRLSM